MHFKDWRYISFAFIALIAATSLFPIVQLVPTARALVMYDSGNPTADEQLVLEYINRARANPVAEGQRLGIDIHEGLQNPDFVGPRPPLAMNPSLLGIAEAHSSDMYNDNYFSHNDPNGTTPFDRMINAGYNYALAGENMAAGTDVSAGELEDFMMVDSGTPGRPHRVNLLDLLNPYPCDNPPCAYSEVGVGYYLGATGNSIGNAFITEDFGNTGYTGPFLLGAVFDDRNGNNFYDVGEGIGGVTITPSAGAYYAITSSSGGYAIPIGTSGTITVTASGLGIGQMTRTVTLTGANIKLDFAPQNTSTATTSQSATQTTSILTTQISSQTSSSTAQIFLEQPQSEWITFQTMPSNFVGASSPGAITACGNTFVNSQSTSYCPVDFSSFANLPAPPSGWVFDHWTWTGGIACSSNKVNPVTCSTYGSGGVLMAVYAAQVNVLTNPASSALMSWGSCSNPSLRNGDSFLSTTYGSTTVTACQLPSGYSFSSWTCSGGLSCSPTVNPTTVSVSGPGTITLNLQTAINQISTFSTSSTVSDASQSASGTASTTSTLTQSAPEFNGQTEILGAVLVAALLIPTSGRRLSTRQKHSGRKRIR